MRLQGNITVGTKKRKNEFVYQEVRQDILDEWFSNWGHQWRQIERGRQKRERECLFLLFFNSNSNHFQPIQV